VLYVIIFEYPEARPLPVISPYHLASALTDVVIVWKLDRLARSLRQLIDTTVLLNERGVELHSLTENINTTTPSGKLTFHIFAALAEFERDILRQRVNAGLKAARRVEEYALLLCHAPW